MMSADIEDAVKSLSSPSRTERQTGSRLIQELSRSMPNDVAPYANELVAALSAKEAQTRASLLGALSNIMAFNSRVCDKAIPCAEEGLFDEESPILRIQSKRFLCEIGSTTEKRSIRVWPSVDEAIQCYHGDDEFPEFLKSVTTFSKGKIDQTVKDGLRDRLSFDATFGKGNLRKKAQQIIELLG